MKINPSIFGLLITCLLFSLGCKTARKAKGEPIQLKPRTTKFVLKKLSANRIEADWFSAKARINYKDPYESIKFNANIRMRKDSLIWFNARKATVEAIRVLITPDSFFVINRLDKEYAKRSMDWFERKFNLPVDPVGQLSSFQILQEMVLGNPIFFAGEGLNVGIKDAQYQLTGAHRGFDSEYRVGGLKYLLEMVRLVQREDESALEVELGYDDDRDAYPNFSYFRTLNLNGPKRDELYIKVKFSKLEINEPKSIRFSIPGHYTEME